MNYEYILMFHQFLDRRRELDFLDKHHKSRGAEFIVIYGRRRIGKTELIQKFLKNKRSLYFFGREESREDTWSRLNLQLSKSFNDFSLINHPLKNWDLVFDYIHRKTRNRRFAIVFDEFPFIINKFPDILSVLRDNWDNRLRNSRLFIVLCGSSIGMMEEKILSHKSPLYGRRTGQWKLTELPFPYLEEMFPHYSLEDLIKVYGVLDSIPGYITQFEKDKSVFENIEEKILMKGEFLYEEVENLLREEFRDISNYMSIIKNIAGGYTTFNDIYTATNLDKSLISKYLFILEKLGIVKKKFPVTSGFKRVLKGKGSNYLLCDNFFNFWFRFVYPHQDMLERGNTEEVLEIIRKDFNPYLGFIFERVAEEFLVENRNELLFQFNRIGRWWHKDQEIDLLALNEETREITYLEVKWSDLKLKKTRKILDELKEKSKLVKWNNKERKEHFGVIAKKIKGKEKLMKEGYICYDFDDMKK